eukprot:441203-Hanusia_phi.AAC.1
MTTVLGRECELSGTVAAAHTARNVGSDQPSKRFNVPPDLGSRLASQENDVLCYGPTVTITRALGPPPGTCAPARRGPAARLRGPSACD